MVEVEVSLGFGQDPSADPSSWTLTPITSSDPTEEYVRPPVEMFRGRTGEQGSVSPQWCALEVRNPAGRFSPRNPTGPYFGQLRINTPMQVRIDGGSGYVTAITVLVPSWVPRWDGPEINDRVPIRADGTIRRLGQ